MVGGSERINSKHIREIRRGILVLSPGVRRLVRGKGFSIREIMEAGIGIDQARRLGIPIDKRRKTSYEHNINFLREIMEKFNIELVERREVIEEKPIPPPERAPEVPRPEVPSIKSIDDLCENLVMFLDEKKRRRIDKIREAFREYVGALTKVGGMELSEEEIDNLLLQILDDLVMAGYGKRSEKMFSRTEEWDISLAREIIMDRLREFFSGRGE